MIMLGGRFAAFLRSRNRRAAVMSSPGGGFSFGKLISKLTMSSTNADTEPAELDPKLVREMTAYESYRTFADEVSYSIEHFAKPGANSRKSKKNDDDHPYVALSKSIRIFVTYVAHSKRPVLEKAADVSTQLANLEQHYTDVLRAQAVELRSKREEFNYYKQERENLEKCRSHVNRLRNDVRSAKTAVKIENKIDQLKDAVTAFDAQAQVVIKSMENLQTIRESHKAQLIRMCKNMRDHHGERAKKLAGFKSDRKTGKSSGKPVSS